jgi:HSP20 family protein
MKGVFMNKHLPDFWRDNSGRPFNDVKYLQKQIDQMFDDFFYPAANNSQARQGLICDFQDTESHYLFSFDIPGVKKEDLKIELKGNELHVSGERRDEHIDEKNGYRSSQRSYGSFSQSISLPPGVNVEDIETECQDGVLRIAVPKKEESRARQIAVGERKTGFFQKLLGKKNDKDANTGRDKLN